MEHIAAFWQSDSDLVLLLVGLALLAAVVWLGRRMSAERGFDRAWLDEELERRQLALDIIEASQLFRFFAVAHQ